MSESNIVNNFQFLQKRAGAVGITLHADSENFSFSDAPGSNGVIFMKTIQEVEFFIRGYELAYKSGL